MTSLFADPKRRLLLSAGFLAFILAGGLQAMYGPAFLSWEGAFGVSPAQVGMTVSLHFGGSVVMILLSGFLLERLSYRSLLSFCALLWTLGSLAIALSPAWWLILAGALLIGLGYGGLILGMNLLVAQAFGKAAAAALNILNGMFGLGAVLGPLLIAGFLPDVTPPFGVVTLLSALLFGLLLRTSVARAPETPTSGRDPALLLKVLGFVSIAFLYVGAETGSGSWAATYLEPTYGAARGATYTAFFWGAMMVGRFLAAPVSFYLKPATLVLGGAVFAALSLALTHSIGLAPLGFILAGFFFAPVFPTSLVWLLEVFPDKATRVTSWFMASANLGGVVFTPLIGRVIESYSRTVIPTTLTLIALSCALVALVVFLKGGRSSPQTTSAR